MFHFNLTELKEMPQRERRYWYKVSLQLLKNSAPDDEAGTPWA